MYGRKGGREGGGRGTYHTHIHLRDVDEGAAVSLPGWAQAVLVEQVRHRRPDGWREGGGEGKVSV